jgi:hypothetical protein
VSLPEPHPAPPTSLTQLRLPIVEAAGPWIRSHAAGRGPLFFDRTGTNRFDAPTQQYGVLYLATDIQGAFIETFGRQLGVRYVTSARLAARSLTRVTASRPLRLVDLTGPGLAQIGADSRLATESYSLSQQWALAFHQHRDEPDGLLYRSRHDPSQLCAAIFDRAADALTATSFGSLADPANVALLADLLDTYGFSLIV